jgi:hypothetical protein
MANSELALIQNTPQRVRESARRELALMNTKEQKANPKLNTLFRPQLHDAYVPQ